MTIQELAAHYYKQLITKERSNGDKFICVKDGFEDNNFKDLIYKAHDGMLPDDYKYNFIDDALEILSECSDYDNAEWQYIDHLSNYELTQWLGSNLTRFYYADNCLCSIAHNTITGVLLDGYNDEGSEVFNIVKQELQTIFDNLNEAQ